MSAFDVPLPWAISMENPDYRDSLDRYHRIADDFQARYRVALLELVNGEPLLTQRWLDGPYSRHGQMPWVEWTDDPRGGYWIACGLEHRPQVPGDLGATYMWAHYLRDSEDGESFDKDERGYDLKLTDTSARDVGLLAYMTVAGLKLHRRRLGLDGAS